MSILKSILRFLGLSSDARVHISAPGIDVVLTGRPDQVRSLLGVIRQELERSAQQATPESRSPRRMPVRDSQVVLPSELDEWDSPYALPEAAALRRSENDVEKTEDDVDTSPSIAPNLRATSAPSHGDFHPQSESTAQGPLSVPPEMDTVRPDQETYAARPPLDEPPEAEMYGEATAVNFDPRGPSGAQHPIVRPGPVQDQEIEQTVDTTKARIHDTDY